MQLAMIFGARAWTPKDDPNARTQYFMSFATADEKGEFAPTQSSVPKEVYDECRSMGGKPHWAGLSFGMGRVFQGNAKLAVTGIKKLAPVEIPKAS